MFDVCNFINKLGPLLYLSGLYPWTSLMSHHCTANTKITTREDFSYVCTSTVLIPAGEEIVTNYVRVHHIVSQIIIFLFVIVCLRKSCFFQEKVVFFKKKLLFSRKNCFLRNGILLPKLF